MPKKDKKDKDHRVILTPENSLENGEKKDTVEKHPVVITPPGSPKFKMVVVTPPLEAKSTDSIVSKKGKKKVHVPKPPQPEKMDDKLMAEKIISLISQGNSRETYLNQLKAFGIPDQKRLLRFLLDKDSQIFDFGGLMRKYYSFILRSYTFINMQDNYREPYTFLTCFSGLEVSKIGSKEEEQEKEMIKKLKQREEKQEDLRYVSIDEEHFLFLKQLANEQPTTIPLTVLKGLVEQAMPILMDTYRTYARTFGNAHESTKLSCEQYVRMKTRMHLYNQMENLPVPR